ncbi:SDR family oxidoreductase [Streptomyces sp. NPDC057199]|uniref:SDR family oxidoreductase n=1 Tax=Streptomyces sp. NPDC057199 TaxID=3346047 RepID=UPI003643ED7C
MTAASGDAVAKEPPRPLPGNCLLFHPIPADDEPDTQAPPDTAHAPGADRRTHELPRPADRPRAHHESLVQERNTTMTSLNGATVLVTGANGGLGTELVKAALDRGARRVYATARSPKEWGDERVVPLRLDVADPEAVDRIARQAGDTTILINNAAVYPKGDLLTASAEDITTTIDTNLLGPIRLTQTLAPALRSARGALVNVGSVLGWLAIGKAHSVSKAGLWMATNAFRLELAPAGVQVLGVYAGPTDTPMQAGNDPAGMNKPSDVASAILDAVEAGDHELFVDELTTKVHTALSAPVTALYPALAQ